MLTFALALALALAHRQERFRREGIVGALLVLAGIVAVFGSGLGAGVPLASLIGALCWAEALIVAKGFPSVPPATMNAVTMTVGALLLLVVSAAVGEEFALPRSASTWGAQAYLVFAGSLGIFWLYLFVLGRWTASAASYQLVLIPIVTVAVSAWLQDERITPAFAAGSLLVLAGVYVGALRRPTRQVEVAAPQQSRPAHESCSPPMRRSGIG